MPNTRHYGRFPPPPSRWPNRLFRLLICLPALGAHLADTHAALTCHAPSNALDHQPPCGVGSALGPAREPDLDTGISNPIHRVTGEKFLRDIDLPASLDGGSPGFVRLYRSHSATAEPLGVGWSSDYDVTLLPGPQGWRLQSADGRIVSYDPQGEPLRAGDGRIQAISTTRATDAGDATHRWLGQDGRRLDFDAQGRLLAIRRPGQPVTRIVYHPGGPYRGLIAEVRQGAQHLTLNYSLPGPLLRSLDTPLGRFSYDYDVMDDAPGPVAAGAHPYRLSAVTRPDGMQRRYHYEPPRQAGHPAAITGITLQDQAGKNQRIRSWSYDAQGRVAQAIPGPPGQGAGRLDLQYPHPPSDAVRRDDHGRLQTIGGLHIGRAPDGRIRSLSQTGGGWPGLLMEYDGQSRRSAWHSTLTGRTQLRHDSQGRLLALHHANGDALTLQRDAAGRPAHLRYTGAGKADIAVALQWRGRRLRRLDHPDETEDLDHDAQGRVRVRAVRRRHPSGLLQYRETFAYDDAGRLLRHDLPEGGALHYTWSPENRLLGLTWRDRQGAPHPVIDTVAGLAGYRYGNGLHLQTGTDRQGRADRLTLSDGQKVLMGEHRLYDADGRLMQQHLLNAGRRMQRRYAYDGLDRLIGIHERADSGVKGIRHWLAWADDGRLIGRSALSAGPDGALPAAIARTGAAAPAPAAPAPSAIGRDAAGLPLRLGGRSLRYQAQQRLAEVGLSDHEQVHYTYNARGQQIRQQSGAREIERYYQDNRLAARWFRPAISDTDPAPRFGVSERYLYAQDVPVGLLRTDATGRTRLFFIHADLLGAPILISDDRRAIRWSAVHDILGRISRISGDLSLPLRWPGQDEDPFTGWHDNVFRTYLPQRGHYLEPDPLGPVPGQQALGYAAQQPLRHIDPLGLILLAFDSTRYGRANQSNVWKLTHAYDDGPTYYHAGPGNNLYMDWDAVTAASSSQILRNQWESLMNALQRAQGAAAPVPIDILGYSRGAALARDFANRIARQTRNGWFSYDDPLRGTIGLCVDLRFLGLFDTVAQFGLLGAANAGFDLSIDGAWSWVAHAVALHELRSLFPLVSAGAGAPANTVEAPFIGAHADIGGGLLLNEHGQTQAGGDLSDVALNWMRWQALAALMPMKALTPEDQQVTRPWLHDERSPAQRLLAGDRKLQNADARPLGPQGADPLLGAAQRRLFEDFIQRISHWELNAGNVVGQVDMQGYGAWLEEQLGMPGMGAPAADSADP